VTTLRFTEEGVHLPGTEPVEGRARLLARCPCRRSAPNCSVGSSVLYDVLEAMLPEAGGLPLVIQPNAGLPSRVGERLMYLSLAGATWRTMPRA
jgi:methionine synthase I (cobalamin-dependent)